MPQANALLVPMLLLPEMDEYWAYEQTQPLARTEIGHFRP